jgi:hypothetical protein
MERTVDRNGELSWLDEGLASLVSKLFRLAPGARSYARSDIRAVMQSSAVGLGHADTQLIRFVSFLTEVVVTTGMFLLLMAAAMSFASLTATLGSWHQNLPVALAASRFFASAITVAAVALLFVELYRAMNRAFR